MDFPRKLSRLLDLRGISQSEAARRIGLSPSAITDMTSGRRRPYMDQGLALSRLLGVSLDALADDAIDEPTSDGLTEPERRLLWLAEVVGIEEAIRRVAAATRVEQEAAYAAGLKSGVESARREMRSGAVALGEPEEESAPEIEVEAGATKTLAHREVPMPGMRKGKHSKKG